MICIIELGLAILVGTWIKRAKNAFKRTAKPAILLVLATTACGPPMSKEDLFTVGSDLCAQALYKRFPAGWRIKPNSESNTSWYPVDFSKAPQNTWKSPEGVEADPLRILIGEINDTRLMGTVRYATVHRHWCDLARKAKEN